MATKTDTPSSAQNTASASLPEIQISEEILNNTADEIANRMRLIENEMKIMKNEATRLTHEQTAMKERIKENNDKIKLNRQLPYLVGNVVEVSNNLAYS